jgi:hypothetical protein
MTAIPPAQLRPLQVPTEANPDKAYFMRMKEGLLLR